MHHHPHPRHFALIPGLGMAFLFFISMALRPQFLISLRLFEFRLHFAFPAASNITKVHIFIIKNFNYANHAHPDTRLLREPKYADRPMNFLDLRHS
ncbi:hypothetical protein CC78DRAFT_583905 [Lojkania enalia]|uniref:Uncharacterized protein n=1 Tax=Lojkania enalia TaxID=147567 RepID=A0A9P4K3K4_9PLEO|nr:hypothetical protein CC78DRAFT_583905 [Didymosphaeria enalia]